MQEGRLVPPRRQRFLFLVPTGIVIPDWDNAHGIHAALVVPVRGMDVAAPWNQTKKSARWCNSATARGRFP